MKQLQNNFTTPEQSKRLLDLGVPADSADCYTIMTQTDIIIHVWHSAEGDALTLSKFLEEMEVTPSYRAISFYPCWSVGRLIEILELCCLHNGDCGWEHIKYIPHEQSSNLIEDLMCCIEGHKIMSEQFETYKLDFSKLEE